MRKQGVSFLNWAAAGFAAILAAGVNPAAAQDQHSRKPLIPARLAAGPNAVSENFGDVAVLVDNGLMVTPRNLFDLAGVTVRFTPAGGNTYTVSHYEERNS